MRGLSATREKNDRGGEQKQTTTMAFETVALRWRPRASGRGGSGLTVRGTRPTKRAARRARGTGWWAGALGPAKSNFVLPVALGVKCAGKARLYRNANRGRKTTHETNFGRSGPPTHSPSATEECGGSQRFFSSQLSPLLLRSLKGGGGLFDIYFRHGSASMRSEGGPQTTKARPPLWDGTGARAEQRDVRHHRANGALVCGDVRREELLGPTQLAFS